MSDDIPTPDQVPGARHPRDTETLVGQDTAEQDFLTAFQASRIHHAWLLCGPRGTGKATLAYKIARFLLATPSSDSDSLFGAPPPPTTLDIPHDHPVAQRVAAGSEPGLRVVIRSVNPKTDRLRDQIVVDDIRRMSDFFHLSMADGGHRVVIIDAADDMNSSAANALLKMLEEPPADTTMLLLSHQPSRLLPTIRSRCRILRARPLSADAMMQALDASGADVAPSVALSELSAGSVGAALRLNGLSGLAIYSELIAIFGSLPRLDRPRALALSDAAAQRGAEQKLDLLIDLMDVALSRLCRQGASGRSAPEAAPEEAAIFERLAPTPFAARVWATQAGEISARLRHGRSVNLDPAAMLLDTLIKLSQTAHDIQSPAPA